MSGEVSIIRDSEVPGLLERDPSRGRVLETRAAVTWESRATVRTSGPMELNPLPAAYDVPPMVRREWYDVVALPRQVVLSGDLLLPESFTTADGRRQRNPTVDKISPRLARRPDVPDDLPVLEGAYLHLENVMPRHFGHALSETVSRFWAWQPGLTALVFDESGQLPAWQRDLLRAAGIDDVHVATGPVRVETLVGATPMFSRPAYVHPDLRATYDAVGAALEERATTVGAAGADLPDPATRQAVVPQRRRGRGRVRRRRLRRRAPGGPPAGRPGRHGPRRPIRGRVRGERDVPHRARGRSEARRRGLVRGVPVPQRVPHVGPARAPARHRAVPSGRPAVDGAFTRESFHSDYIYDPARDGGSSPRCFTSSVQGCA